MAGHAKVRFKAGDIWDVPEDNLRYEVIDGDLFVTPAPSWSHQMALMRLSNAIFNWVQAHSLGFVVQAPTGVVLAEETGVQPDLVYVSADRADIISDRGVEGAPDLIVEVLSPSTEARDRGVKMRQYAATGVAHYWLIDLRARALEAYELRDSGYEGTGVYGQASTFQPTLFPGLQIEIAGLWSD